MPERQKPTPVQSVVRAAPGVNAGVIYARETVDALVTISQQLDYLIDLVAGIERGQ